MNIPDHYFELILNELIEVQKLCDEAKSSEDKLYFFSASYGIINRVMNFHCEPLLVFMHQILQIAHQTMSQRASSPKTPGSISNSLPNELFDSLFSYFSKLVLEFEKKDENKIEVFVKILKKEENLLLAYQIARFLSSYDHKNSFDFREHIAYWEEHGYPVSQ